jgi:uncharacterized protein YkwD
MRRLAALALSAAVLVGAATGPAEAGRAESTYQRQAVKATNAQRTAQGLKPLRDNACLQRAAVRQARLMAQREQMFHQDIGAVLADCGLSTVGENVAYGYPSGRSVVRDGWMESEGHRANILNRGFRLLGLAARKGHDGNWYVAQVFGAKG